MALCWPLPAGAAEPAEAPGRFQPPSRSKPLQVAVEQRGSLQTSRRSKVGRASNSRVIARKAVHISFVDDPVEDGGPAVLRWRNSVASAPPANIVDSDVVPAQAVADDSGPYLAAPAVLESIGDDFVDPFEDGQETAQPPTAAADDEAPMTLEQDEIPQPLQPQDDSRQLELPNQGLQPQPRNTEFNNRDCATEIQDCEEARRQLTGRSIRQISLDISPVFSPQPDESATPPAERSRAFENMERDWHDKQGRLITRGTMAGIENGRVLIEDEDGELQRIEYHDLSDEDLCYFAAWWGIPMECTLDDEEYVARSFTPSTFTWKASALCHKPLYFEEVQLERYGHTAGPIFQPVVSGAHFFLNIATLPYHMGIHPPQECQYALGYYRPGDCAPWLLPPIPLSLRGGLAQAGAVVGGIYVIP